MMFWNLEQVKKLLKLKRREGNYGRELFWKSSKTKRIDGNGNFEEISEKKFKEEILSESQEIMDDYLENFGEDEIYLELEEIIKKED